MDKPTRLTLILFYLLSVQTLCLCVRDPGFAPVELAPIPCNDKAVEQLSRLAVTYINEDRTEGYKFALNHIANVHLHAQVSEALRYPCIDSRSVNPQVSLYRQQVSEPSGIPV